MDRRLFVAALNAGITCSVLGTPALADAGPLGTTPASSLPSDESAPSMSVLASGRGLPKIGVIGVGIDRCILNDLSRHFPCLHRTIAVGTDQPTLQQFKFRPSRLPYRLTLPVRAPGLPETFASTPFAAIVQAVADLDMVLLVAGNEDQASSECSLYVKQILCEEGILSLDLPSLHLDGCDKSEPPDLLMAQAVRPYVQLFRGMTDSVAGQHCITGIDFEDFCHLILGREGLCAFGCGSASGPGGAELAADLAIGHPLMGRRRLQQASAALVAIETPPNALFLRETREIVFKVRRALSPDSTILYSSVSAQSTQGDGFSVSILASGIQDG